MSNTDILFIGDSLTFGYGVSRGVSFVSLIQKELCDKIILNRGVNGDTSTGILTRYYRDVIKYNPKLVVILCGTNDLLMGRTPSSIVENIQLMVKDLLEINSNIILCSPPIILKDLAENLFSPSSYYDSALTGLETLNNLLSSLKEKYPLTFVDLYTLTKSHKNNGIFSDGIHFTAEGHKLIYNELINLMI